MRRATGFKARSLPPSLAVTLHLVVQVTGEGRAGPTFLRHALAAGGLEAEDAVLAGDVAGNGDAALAHVGRRRAALGHGHAAAAVGVVRRHILHSLSGRRRVGVQRRLRRASVAFHRVRRRAVPAVEPAVAPEEFVVRRVRFVP